MGRILSIQHSGLVAYDEAALLQQAAVAARQQQQTADTLILLQHPHVVTLGVRVRNDWSHIIASNEELARLGVTVQQSGRGGDVTYHGPGQLVGYPILELPPGRRDLHRYVRDLEDVLIRTVGHFGVVGGRIAGLTGVWVGDEKIAAIGVRIARWVTSHGFALNVAPDLNYFRLIVPCGIGDRGVTSLSRVLGCEVAMGEVEAVVEQQFREVFGYDTR